MKRNYYRFLLIFSGLILVLFAGSQSVLAQDGEPAEAGVFQEVEVQPETEFEVPVSIRNVEDLYAVDITLEFDPNFLTVEDADPDQEGVQPALGTFLDAGLVLFNRVDNENGTLRFTMTQVNPSEPKSGEGVILVLYFRSLTLGESPLTVTSVELSDRGGNAISVEGVDSSVTISNEAAVQENTPIPVQDTTQMIVVPTAAPTAIPTPTEIPAPTATATTDSVSEQNPSARGDSSAEVVDGETEAEPVTEQAGQDEAQEGFSLINYWWLVALVVLAAIGMALYLIVSKRP